MRIKLIWPKKEVSEKILKVTKKLDDSVVGEIYHDCYGVLITYRGEHILYAPFGNGHGIKLDNCDGLRLDPNFSYRCTFFGFLNRINEVRKTRGGS